MEWIKVTDSLPDNDRDVLLVVRIQGGNNIVDLGYYDLEDRFKPFWRKVVDGEVIAWCEIPEPPKDT